jgi:hypothetical protein
MVPSDRTLVFQLWHSLNTSGRRQLGELINELIDPIIPTGPETTTHVERRETQRPAEASPKGKKPKIWERDILKDVPAVREFAQKSAKDRNEDRGTSQRMSISTGVVARGLAANVSPEEILTSIIDSWGDVDALRSLYQPAPSGSAQRDENQEMEPAASVPDPASETRAVVGPQQQETMEVDDMENHAVSGTATQRDGGRQSRLPGPAMHDAIARSWADMNSSSEEEPVQAADAIQASSTDESVVPNAKGKSSTRKSVRRQRSGNNKKPPSKKGRPS